MKRILLSIASLVISLALFGCSGAKSSLDVFVDDFNDATGLKLKPTKTETIDTELGEAVHKEYSSGDLQLVCVEWGDGKRSFALAFEGVGESELKEYTLLSATILDDTITETSIRDVVKEVESGKVAPQNSENNVANVVYFDGDKKLSLQGNSDWSECILTYISPF